MADPEHVLAAFMDGERVDAEALKRALSQAEGRDYLVDLLALRDMVTDSGATPAGAVPPAPARSTFQWVAAAAVIALSVLGGYLAGSHAILRSESGDATRQITSSTTGRGAQAPATAPEPTHVIRLEAGVDWKERGGVQ